MWSQKSSYVIQWQNPDGVWIDVRIAGSPATADEEFEDFAASIDAARWRLIHRVVTAAETEIRRGE